MYQYLYTNHVLVPASSCICVVTLLSLRFEIIILVYGFDTFCGIRRRFRGTTFSQITENPSPKCNDSEEQTYYISINGLHLTPDN